MKNIIKSFFVAFLSLLALSNATAQTERTSLKLQGCQVDSITGNSDGSLVLASCTFSANGIFYSTDFGQNWLNARGGDYIGGEVRAVTLYGDKAYAAMDHQVFRSSFASRATEGFKPSWTKVQTSAQGVTSIFKAGENYLFIPNGARLETYNIQNEAADGRYIEIPSGTPRAVVYNSSYLFVLADQVASGTVTKNGRALYRVEYDQAAGSLAGGASWQNITANFAGANMSDSDIWAVFLDPTSNTVIAVIRDFQGGGGSWSNNLFLSNDNGGSFLKRVDLAFSANHACFQGNTWAFDEKISRDGGNTFNVPTLPANSVTTVRTEPGGCYIVPSNDKKIMVATNAGVAFTNDITAGGTWQTSQSGFEGLNVLKILQPESNKDKAVMATSSGLAYSANFTSETPAWVFPICPMGDCVGGGIVALDPVNSSNVYTGSGGISRGTFSEDGQSITWSPFGAKPLDAFRFGNIAIFPYDGLKDKLYAAYNRYEGGISGGIYSYPLSYNGQGLQNGTPVTDEDVAGHPIESLTAISADIMFASRGNSFAPSEVAMLVSRDGGASWSAMERGALPVFANPYRFAYDPQRDILYGGMSSQQGGNGDPNSDPFGVYILQPATSASASWVKSPAVFKGADGQPMQGPGNLSDVTVDTATGTLFVAAGNLIWFSEDQAQSFNLMYAGSAKEETQDLNVDADPVTTSDFSAKTRRARLAQGINGGAYAFDLNTIKAVTPVPVLPKASCKLSVTPSCTKKTGVSKNSTCVFTATVKKGKKAYKNASVKLQRALAKTGPFLNYGKARKSDKKGIAKFNAKVAKTSWYKVIGANVSCSSNVIGVKVKGKK